MGIKAKKWERLSLIIIFSMTFFWMFMGNIKDYIGDAYYYWIISDNVYENGIAGFDLLKYPETFRGGIYPLILGLLKRVFFCLKADYMGWWLLASVMCSIEFSVVLPVILNYKIDSLSIFCKTIVCFLLFLFVWGENIKYPLSDFPACLLLFSGVAILKNLYEKNLTETVTARYNIGFGVAGGIVLYCSYNTRVAFLYGAIAAIIIYIILCIKSNRSIKFIYTLAAILVGFFVASIPQSLINYQYVGKFSPRIYTEQLYGYSHDLQKQQIFWGLQYSRYETYVGSSSQYTPGPVYFLDRAGQQLIANEDLSIDTFDYIDLARMFIESPMDVIGIYMRHLLSLMTPLYRDIYISEIYKPKGFLILFSITTWFIGGYYLISMISDNKREKLIWMFPCVFPSLLQMFGAPELRFFLPVYIILYGIISIKINYCILFQRLRNLECRKKLYFIFGLIVAYCVWITIITSILSSNIEKVLLIGG